MLRCGCSGDLAVNQAAIGSIAPQYTILGDDFASCAVKDKKYEHLIILVSEHLALAISPNENLRMCLSD
jgi:hypothetical protein